MQNEGICFHFIGLWVWSRKWSKNKQPTESRRASHAKRIPRNLQLCKRGALYSISSGLLLVWRVDCKGISISTVLYNNHIAMKLSSFNRLTILNYFVCTIAGVLNLGYTYPWGYASWSCGYTKCQVFLIIFNLGVCNNKRMRTTAP